MARITKRMTSCVRASAAIPEASAATPMRPQVGSTRARAISNSASVDSGYASGSSTKNGEYASAGTAVAPPAAASAYHGGTTSRASAYAGKIVAVIASTSRSFAVAYAAVVEPSHQTGARK